MADAFDELKEKTILPELQEVGSESSLPAEKTEDATENTTEDTSAAPPAHATVAKNDKRKNPRSPEDGYRWLIRAGITIAVAIMIIIPIIKLLLGFQSAPEIAEFFIKSPAISKMEHLSGYGYNIFIMSKRNLRFFTKEPVEVTRQDKRTRITSKDPIFQEKLETFEALFPDDKKDLEAHREAIEIWDRMQEETLLHDRVSGMYLLNVDAG